MPVPGPFTGVVALDGPAGSGKSSVARAVAQRLGVRYLDTGAMYRAAAWAVLAARADPADAGAVTAVVAHTDITVSVDPDDPAVLVDGAEVTDAIRTGAVTAVVSAVAAIPGVRAVLIPLQQQRIGAGAIVVEGRDIAAVVAPDADVKVFLTASPSARAARRSRQDGTDRRSVAVAIDRRDATDSRTSPLRPAPGAVEVDTTGLTLEQAVQRVLDLVSAGSRR